MCRLYDSDCRKGSLANPANYRYISLLSVISKILVSIVYDQLYKHVEWILPDNQSGFRHRDGSVLQLARVVHELAAGIDMAKTTMACFCDFSKAFVDGLLLKLHHYGDCKLALALLKEYMKERKQRVRVGDVKSAYRVIPAGVPQGSVLEPLLSYLHSRL